jgi:hypothetical protein
LVEDEDLIAFWISLVVTFVHGTGYLVRLVASLTSETGGAGQRAWRNDEAFPLQVVAVVPCKLISGVDSFLCGLVYLRAWKISLSLASERKVYQILFFSASTVW